MPSIAFPTPSKTARSRCLLLFDLDGTLLLTHGAGARAMQRAGQHVWGSAFSVEAVNFGGSLDPVIIREATRLGRLQFCGETHAAFRARYLQELRCELSACGDSALLLPGVMALLRELQSLNRHILGLLTGNYEETGVLKLRSVGIDPGWFSPRVWGDAGPTRPDLVKVALGFDHRHPREQVVIIGDTDKDIHCAKVNGCKAVGVATGGCSREQLLAAGADLVLADLSQPALLYDFLEAL